MRTASWKAKNEGHLNLALALAELATRLSLARLDRQRRCQRNQQHKGLRGAATPTVDASSHDRLFTGHGP